MIQGDNAQSCSGPSFSFGGGDIVSKDTPLYIEGTVAINRYDPSYKSGTSD
jgi:hypothetical protein